MGYLKAGDIISGQEASATMTIKNGDGTSSVETMFFAKKVEGKVEVKKSAIKTLGKRGEQTKFNGWSGTGSMTVYFVTSLFRKMMLNYIKNGIPIYFDLVITNDDPASVVGSQTTILKQCSINSVVMAKLDVESESLEEDLDFTFDDVDMTSEFEKPSL